MRYVAPVCLFIVGVIHLLPLAGVPGSERLTALYGIPVEGANLEILMRHRAALFGLLGALLVYAAFRPKLRVIAFVAGFVSVVSFLWLALATGGYNDAIGRVVVADWLALACLAVGSASLAMSRRGQ